MTEPASFARYSCMSCRKGKRKCTKELPTCQLCQKARRPCMYTSEAPLEPNVSVKEAGPTSRRSLQPLFFLDEYTYGQRHRTIENPKVPLPPEFANRTSIWDFVDRYFATCHLLFPVVSKRQAHQSMDAVDDYIDTDLLALFHSMKLLAQPQGDNCTSAEYTTTRQIISLVESQGTVSLRLLQAVLLLSFYEMANGIYPAAYLSVGHCARLGHAMGTHDRRNTPQMFPHSNSWTKAEEARRVWWGVIVMDRVVNLGMRGRPFACDDARPEDLLPINEDSWEMGEQVVSPSLAVSADTSIPASPFARTCQAAHLLSRVLAHINSNWAASSPSDYYSHSMQLHHVLMLFHTALSEDLATEDTVVAVSLSSALGICHSAMIALYDAHSCADVDDPAGVGLPEQLNMQKTSLNGLHAVAKYVCDFTSRLPALREFNSGNILVSPFIAMSMYTSAMQYMWYINETGKRDLWPTINGLTDGLKLLGHRWNVANEYLSILAKERPQSS